MNEDTDRWAQYGRNPYIQRNTLTKEFRCIKCNLPLGDNSGGAGSHCKSSHGIRIDGSPIEKPKIQEKNTGIQPVVSQPHIILQKQAQHNPKTQEIKARLIREIRELDSPKTDNKSVELYKEMQEMKDLWSKYKELENCGVPESKLRSIRIILGIEDDYQKKKKELKQKQEQKEYYESLKRLYMIKLLMS